MKITEEQLNKVSAMIFNKIPKLNGFDLEDIKELVRFRANEIMNNN